MARVSRANFALGVDWPRLRFQPDMELTDREFTKLCRANSDLRLERTLLGE